MAISIIETGNAVVKCEPRGEHGLEGYGLNDNIKYAKCEKDGKEYYRVWHQRWEKDNYYETCGKSAFNKYFKII